MGNERTKAALKAAKARGVKLGGFRAGEKVTAEMRRNKDDSRIETAIRVGSSRNASWRSSRSPQRPSANLYRDSDWAIFFGPAC